MKSISTQLSGFLLGFMILSSCLYAQPTLNTKTKVNGLVVYQDFKDSTLFYYIPPEMKLKMEANGRPVFQFLAMRYTGTSCRDDQGEKSFMSVAQFTIQRPLMDKNKVYQAERELRYKSGGWASLKPIPLAGIEARLVAPIGTNPDGSSQNRAIGSLRSGADGPSDWTEKTFTLRLDPVEAQLLIDNMEKEQLAISFAYTYLAETVGGIDVSYELTGDSAAQAALGDLQDELLNDEDTLPKARIIYGNSLGILADVNKWPQNLKKVDVNAEGFPSGFPSVEIRCYDFADKLRPDLAIKRVSLQAYTLGGQLSRPINYQFGTMNRKAIAQNVKFPVVIDMSRGFRYQVTEIMEDGTMKKSNGWTEADFCEGLLDMTTDPDNNPIEHRTLEVEVDRRSMESRGVNRARFVVNYSFGGKKMTEELSFGEGSYQDFQTLDLAFDKEVGLEVKVVWEDYGEQRLGRKPLDGYYYLVVE